MFKRLIFSCMRAISNVFLLSSVFLVHKCSNIKMVTKDLPIGVKLVKVLTRRCQWNFNKDLWNKGLILVLTFLSYMSYHFTRKPISVVKNVLHPNCSNALQSTDKFHSGDNCSGWAPFGMAYYHLAISKIFIL